MKELSPGARALLEQYRDHSEIYDQPDASVLQRIEESIDPSAASPTQTPRRAAAWVLPCVAAAAAVAVLWVWAGGAELRKMTPAPVSTAVDQVVEQVVEQVERYPLVPQRALSAPSKAVLPTTPLREPSPPTLEPQPRERPLVAEPTEPTEPAEPDDSLQRELGLLRRARQAVGQGQSLGAKAALGAHARLYPQGQLAEEREALLVVVRCTDGDANTGRAAFEALYPRSHHLPSIRVACGSAEKESPGVTDDAGGGK